MSTNQHTEANYENTLIQLFQELGYEYECGYDVERDYRNPYYEEDLRQALRTQNPLLRADVLEEAFRLVTHVNEGTLEQRNERRAPEDGIGEVGELRKPLAESV